MHITTSVFVKDDKQGHLSETTVAVQGYGDVGSAAAMILQEMGCKVAAVGDVSAVFPLGRRRGQSQAGADHDPQLAGLQTELGRAQVARPEAVSRHVNPMNSMVVSLDVDTQGEETCTLLFPARDDASCGLISFLAPIGVAMIGKQVGDIFESSDA